MSNHLLNHRWIKWKMVCSINNDFHLIRISILFILFTFLFVSFMSDEVQALFPFNFMKTNNNKIQGKTKPKNKGFFAKFKNFFRFKKSGKQMDAKPISSIPTFHADEPQRLPSEKADPYWVKARRKQYFDMGLGHDVRIILFLLIVLINYLFFQSKYPEHKNPYI